LNSFLVGKNYKLLQFHFHTPSENRINGDFHSLNATFSPMPLCTSRRILAALAFQQL